jgi:hypothetical protein
MSTVSGGPNTVLNNLVLYLDAANSVSYPGTGTTWTDLSQGGNNSTLVNGPTFNTANGGSIVFDGTNDYVNLGNPQILNFGDSSSYSICFWLIKFTPFKNYDEIISKGISGNQRIHFLIDSTGKLWRWDAFSTDGLVLNKWTSIIYTYNSTGINSGTEVFYLDGIQTSTRTGSMPSWVTSNDIWLGYHAISGGSWPFNGRIAQTLIYNKALSATEILQNYNATKGRYGL